MRTIFKTQFGSHVYGTNLPSSDLDYKSIFIPDVNSILLQRAKGTIVKNTKADKNSRNTKDDVDDEQFSLHQYLKLLSEGQTVALDMLFTPQKWWVDSSLEWETIRSNKEYLVHKGTSSFVGYTRQQAAKYGVKGFRVAALKHTLDWLDGQVSFIKLKDTDVVNFVERINNEHISIALCKSPNNTEEPHLQVCNRKVPFHATVKYVREIFGRIYNEYGNRARLAEQNEGIDWKALMHAVRVAREAEELLTTGKITFPRPEKDLLLQIRQGILPYKQVAEIIEQGLNKIEEAQNKSVLPISPDFDKIDQLVLDIYSKEVMDAYRSSTI